MEVRHKLARLLNGSLHSFFAAVNAALFEIVLSQLLWNLQNLSRSIGCAESSARIKPATMATCRGDDSVKGIH